MRWSIIRLIFLRELRDQLRDRRTMFVMVVLPLLLYPLAGVGLMQITLGAVRKPGVVGIVGAEHLPSGGKLNDFPPLLERDGPRVRFPDRYFPSVAGLPPLGVELLDSDDRTPLERGRVDLILIVPPDFRAKLENRQTPVLTMLSRPDD